MTSGEAIDRLGVIVVNYGSSSLIAQNLAHKGILDVAATVIVVDNYSTVDERDKVSSLARREGWELVCLPNVGYGAGNNAGVDRAIALGCSIFLMINPDASIRHDDVRKMYEYCVANPLTLLAPRIVNAQGSTWFAGASLDRSNGRTTTRIGSDSSGPDGWITGACIMMHERLWRRVGGFDHDYFLYWEDVDISWRCRAAGGALVVRPEWTALHTVGGTQESTTKSGIYVRYNCRNRLLFAGKFFEVSTLYRWLLYSPRYALSVCMRGHGRRVLLRRPALLVGAVRGTAAGAVLAIRELGRRRRIHPGRGTTT